MIPKYSNIEFDNAKSSDKLLCECHQCHLPFLTPKREINYYLNGKRDTAKFCSRECRAKFENKHIEVSCLNCDSKFMKKQAEINRNKNHFCSHSCSASYNNKHKTKGNRRSKLETWLEEQLTILYPNLEIHYNKTSAINSELDIYIPSLNIAFELNGIFHYEPIYGVNKLHKIQENDQSKTKACHEAKIDLCIIDTSAQKYVKPHTSQKYLDIILNIIKERYTN
jgi:transposase-like protein